MLHNRKAQPRAAQCAVAMVVCSVESLGQARQMACGNPRPLIAHANDKPATAQQRRLRLFARSNVDMFTRATIFHRILDDVREDLRKLVHIAAQGQTSVWHIQHQFHPSLGGYRLQGSRSSRKDSNSVHHCFRTHPLVRFHTAQRQQIAHKAVHSFRLTRHRLKEARTRLCVIACRAAQGLDKAHERGEWRAQLVANIGHKITAHLAGSTHMGHVLKQDQHGTRVAHATDRNTIGTITSAFACQVFRVGLRRSREACLDRLGNRWLAQSSNKGPPQGLHPEQFFGRPIKRHDLFALRNGKGRHRQCRHNIVQRERSCHRLECLEVLPEARGVFLIVISAFG